MLFRSDENLTNENLASKQPSAANLAAEANLTQTSDKENASVNLTAVKNAQNRADLNLTNGTTNANLTDAEIQIYKISNSRVKSLLVVQDKVYIGLGNGEILRSDAEFKQIEKIGKNSDAVIKIFNDEDSVIAVSVNGEIKIYEIKS